MDCESNVMNPAAPPSQKQIIRSTVVVMMGFLLTKSISLVQTIIIASEFGAGAEYDTFVQGNTLPEQIIRLIGGGALTVAFLPAFSALLNKDNTEGAWRLASQVFNTLLVVASTTSLITFIFADPLVEHIIAPGMPPSDMPQTANILRILSVAAIIFSVSGIVSGVLHGHNHFLLPVLAPVFLDIGLLFGVIFLTGPFGIYGLAWGTFIGSIMHIGIQIPGLIRFKFSWMPNLGWRDPELWHIVRLMIPRVLIGLAFTINILAINRVNSFLGEGAASAFSWGIRFMDVPQALIGTAIGTVIFPTLAALSASGKETERRNAFAAVMRFIIVASIPATAGLVMVSYPVLRLLFTEYESAIIYTVIQIMSLAIIIQSLHEVLTRSFYAQEDTVRPLIFSIVATVVTVLLVVVGYAIFLAQDPPLWSPLAVGFPALAYVVSFLVEVILLTIVLRRRWGDIALPELVNTGLQTLIATGVMVIAVLLATIGMAQLGLDELTTGNILIQVVVRIGVGVVAFGIAGWLLRIAEIRDLPMLLRQWRSPQEETTWITN